MTTVRVSHEACRERRNVEEIHKPSNMYMNVMENNKIAWQTVEKWRKVQTKLIDPNFPRPIPMRYCTDDSLTPSLLLLPFFFFFVCWFVFVDANKRTHSHTDAARQPNCIHITTETIGMAHENGTQSTQRMSKQKDIVTRQRKSFWSCLCYSWKSVTLFHFEPNQIKCNACDERMASHTIYLDYAYEFELTRWHASHQRRLMYVYKCDT